MMKHLVAYVAIGIAVRLAVALWGIHEGSRPLVSASDRFGLRIGYVLGILLGVLLWPLLVIGPLAKVLAVARHGPKGGA